MLTEALNYASQGHQANLEAVLKESPEAIVDNPVEETDTNPETIEEGDAS